VTESFLELQLLIIDQLDAKLDLALHFLIAVLLPWRRLPAVTPKRALESPTLLLQDLMLDGVVQVVRRVIALLRAAFEEHLLLENLAITELLKLESLLQADSEASEALGRQVGTEFD